MSAPVPPPPWAIHPLDVGCGCRACIERDGVGGFGDVNNGSVGQIPWMVLCRTCGNKRCPHATHHDLACTNSNEPGQKGSVYE